MEKNLFLSRRYLLAGLLAGASLAFNGCAHFRSNYSGVHDNMPCEISERYQHRFQEVIENRTDLSCFEKYSSYNISLEFRDETKTNKIDVIFYQSNKAGKKPGVIILPVNGGSYVAENYFGSYFASRGADVAIIKREKGKRLKEIISSEKYDQLDDYFMQNIKRAGYTLDWLASRDDVDPNKIALFGLSRGGIDGVCFMAFEDRISAGFVGLAAGNLPYLMSIIPEKEFVDLRNMIKCNRNISNNGIEDLLEENIHIDPSNLARYVPSNKILMVIALTDRIVPSKEQIILRKELGYPETIFIPFGHYYSIISAPFLKSTVWNFFERKFDEKR